MSKSVIVTRPFLLFLFFLFNLFIAKGQDKTCSISGKIVNQNKLELQGITVSLLNKDSTIVTSIATDLKGNFSIKKIRPKDYILFISSIDYQQKSIPVLIKSDTTLTITLGNKLNVLQEVQIKGETPLFERKVDRVVFDVSNSVVAKGNTLINVLQLLPGVVLDGKDNIQISGKDGVKFLIDGKPVKWSNEQLTAFLKSVQADNVKSIDLITNPSAKYDAEGSAGLINIKFKKNKQKGLTGDINSSYTQGKYGNSALGADLSYKVGKINTFLNYSYNYNNYLSNANVQQNYLSDPQNTVHLTNTFDRSTTKYNFLNTGIDYDLKKDQVIGFMIDASYYTNNEKAPSKTSIFNNNKVQYDSLITNNELTKNQIKNIDANLNYTNNLDSLGSSFVANIDYAYSDNHTSYLNDGISSIYSDNQLFDPFHIGYYNPNITNLITEKFDYTKLDSKHNKFEIGLKSGYVETDNNIQYDASSLFNNSNKFIYKENINAGYFDWEKDEWKNWSFQAGIRVEQTNTSGDLNSNSNFHRNYLDFFPSAFIQRTINTNNQINFSYSRRINRPTYSNLNPFQFYVDQYNLIAGNPNLKPMYTNSYELSYTLYSKYTLSASYSRTDNVFALIPLQNDVTKTTISTYSNINVNDNYNFELDIPISFTKSIRSNFSLAYYINNYSTTINADNDFNSHKGTFNANGYISVKLPKDIQIDFSGFYVSPHEDGIILVEHKSSLTTGLSKGIFDGNGTLSMRFSDIFHSNIENTLIQFSNQKTISHLEQDTRQISLSFSYRFNKGHKFNERDRRKGNDDEGKRIKN